MRISLFNNYGAKNSAPVFQAIAKGLLECGHSIVNHDNSADVAVIWSMLWSGRMKGNREVYTAFRSHNKPVIVAEVGMINRNQTWKLGLNGTGFANYPTHIVDHNRAAKLGIQCREWRSSGSNIVIACQRTDSEQWSGQPALQTWLETTIAMLRQHTDRPIVVRERNRSRTDRKINRVENALGDVHALVTFNSVAATEAVLAGVPAFVLAPSNAAAPVASRDLSEIDTPYWPDDDKRYAWACHLAYGQWHVREIQNGSAYRMLNES